jgi:hypothetical protein
VTVIHLSEEEQKPFAEGIENGNKIFKKKSDVLTFKIMKNRTVFFPAEKPSKG